MEAFPGDSEQDRILAEAKQAIKRNAYSMRKAMDEDNMREALRFSAAMLSELRSSQLSPQKYYELYMLVFDQLVNMEVFFGEERGKGRSYSELYELVQHAGNVLPRLYLMVAVGCLYIKSKEAGAKDILKDLVEMCKGVQHPTRGLFLRSFLCQRSRGLLPDTGSEYEGPRGGDISDAIEFLMSNFVEMNKLWVRMQHQGSARDKEKREKERQQLADLVGKNLTYISQLDGLVYERYASQVLPRVMEQVVTCKDDIAQQYLFQAVIQVFPDAFHLGTLDTLLNALPELQPGVKVHSVVASLMDRLARYAAADKAVMARLLEMTAFERFRDAIARIISVQASMPPADCVEMYVALMNFTGSVHPNIVTNVNQVLAAAHQALAPRGLANDTRAERALFSLLTIPITKYDVVTGLGLSEYPLLMGLLRQRTHKELATRIVQSVIDTHTRISTVEKVKMMFKFIQPLVHDGPIEGSVQGSGDAGYGSIDDLDDEDVQIEQVLVARLLHSLVNDDPYIHFQLLTTAYEQLLKGGPRRLKHSLPPLGFAVLALCKRAAALERARKDAPSTSSSSSVQPPAAMSTEGLLKWLLNLSLTLADLPQPLLALRLLLAGGVVCSEEARLEALAYEFLEQAFILYEEGVPDQRSRMTALYSILSTLHCCHVFKPEQRDALVTNAAGYAALLLRKSDQCKAMLACTMLAWQEEESTAHGYVAGGQPPVRDGAKVLSFLKRAWKIAAAAKEQLAATGRTYAGRTPAQISSASLPGISSAGIAPATLMVDVLNHYLLLLEKGVDSLSSAAVQHVLEQVQNELLALNQAPPPSSAPGAGGQQEGGAGEGERSGLDSETRRYWRATVAYIQKLQEKSEGGLKGKMSKISLSPAAVAL